MAITSDEEGNNVVSSAQAQITADFWNNGTCVGHRYLFDFPDTSLSGGTTYYLRTKALAGAPIRAWNGVELYY